jgi:tetratricopeptide (TPR) repeat protein
MNDIENLEKIIMETNRLVLSDFERIGVIWNHPNSIIEPKMKVHSVEEIDNLESINKGFHEIKHHLTKIKVKDQKNYEKYSEYFQKMHDSYLKATSKLELANNLKEASLNKTNSLEVALAYLAPFLGFLDELAESTVCQNEKSILLSKMAWYYHRKALNLGKRLSFKAMPNLVYAKKLYYQAWESNKKNYDAVHGLAKCMYKLSKFKTCIDFLTEEFKLEAEKKEIRDYYRMLAICHRKIGEYEKAKEEILFAIKHEPNNPKLAKERKLIERLIEKKKTEDYEEILFESNDNTVMKYIKQDYIHRHTESEEFRILSIDGGGIRGIIPAYWACEIEKRAHKPLAYLFNMLAGTSTGGIIAAGLSFPDKDGISPKYRAYELLDVYRHRGGEIFPQNNWLKEKIDTVLSIFGSRYKDDGRKNLFIELLGKEKISSSLTELVVTTANEDCILSTHLFNRFDARYDEFFNDYYVDALMCTSAGNKLLL